MPWARLDDDFHDNGKILSLSHQAFRLYVCAITYCRRHRTVGFLTPDQVGALCGQQRVSRKAVDELVEKHAWHAVGGMNHGKAGYQVHDFAEYQPRGDETAADRMRRYRERNKTPHSHGGYAPNVTPSYAGVTRNGDDPIPIPIPVTHEASSQSEHIQQKETARAGATALERAQALAVPKPGLAPSSPQTAILTAFAAATGYEEPSTISSRRKWIAGAVELLHATPPVSPDEMPGLVERYREENSVPVTLPAIAGQLPQLRSAHLPSRSNGRHESTRAKLDRVFEGIG